MTRSSHHLRLFWIALTAIAGLLSMAGEVLACEAKSGPKLARSCCASQPSLDCGDCCNPTESSPRAETLGRTDAPVTTEAGLAVPQRSCECRSGEPSAPASRPESRPYQTRADRDRDADVAFTLEELTPVPFARLAPRPDGPPKIPLYLSTSRLLI